MRIMQTRALAEFVSSPGKRLADVETWCKDCRRTYDAAYHARTRERRRALKKALQRSYAAWYRQLKENRPCADCGGRFHHAAMAWDHLPGSVKVMEVSRLMEKTHSKRRVLAEIAKCELVCANCHAVRTFERRGVAQPG